MPHGHLTRHTAHHLPWLSLLLLALLALGSFGQQLATLFSPPAALAATIITVTTTDDELNSDGDCSLREAIQAANTDSAVDACPAGSGADTIQFSVPASSVITLTSGEIALTQSLTLDGTTATNLTFSGNDTNRVFNASAPLAISSLTFVHGKSSGDGGGINSSSTVTLTNTIFKNNTASVNGGGIFVSGAITIIDGAFQNNRANVSSGNSNGGGGLYGNSTVTITGTSFTSNSSGFFGGAVYAVGTATITNAQFLQNAGNGRGGALHTLGAATLTNTIFRSNSVSGGEGGAVLVNGSAVVNGGAFIGNQALPGGFPSGGGMTVFQDLQLTGTQFIGNTSASYAGALRVGGTATIENALFARNSAPNGAALDLTNNAQIKHSTFGSPALTSGAAIYVEGSTVNIEDTIVTSHTVGIQNVGGAVTEDYNLLFGNTTNLAGTVTSGGHDQLGAPHFLGSGCDIYKIGPGSAAIDTGTDAAVTADFEGDARPLLSGFDIGYDEVTSLSLELPILCLSATNGGPAARGSPIPFAATVGSGTNVTYDWSFGDGQTGSGATPSHTYAAAGSYTAIITATNPLGSANATTTVQVLAPPILSAYPASSVQFSRNTTISPGAAPANAQRIVASAPPTFKGTMAVNPATGLLRLTNAYPAGTYPITLTAFASNGTSAAQTLNLTVNTPSICNYGAFNPATNLTSLPAKPISAAVGDFNNDGKQDLAVISWTAARLSIYLGNGAGGFAAPTTYATGSGPWGIAVRDLNGDGNQDLVIPNSTSNNVYVYLGNGAGGFGAPSAFGVGTAPYAVVIGDFNKDAKFDLAVGNLNSSNISVLLGDGTGSFGAATAISLGTRPHNINIGDFNGDGNLDLVTANFDTATTSVLLGNGAGGFGAPVSFAAGTNPTFVGIGDFNEDGKPDLAISNYGAGTLSVLLGNGAGSFAAKTDFTTVSQPFGASIGDFNRDGHLDLATSSQNSARVAVLLGTGTGSFGTATNVTVGSGPYPPAVGDFNADGKQDLAVPNFSSNTVSLLGGQCGPTITDIADTNTNEDTATGAIPFTVGDPETAAGSLSVTGSSSNTTLVPNANIVFGGSGASRTVTVTPAANQSGTATITVQVSDGVASTTDTFVVTVNPANDVPSFTKGANQTVLEDAGAQSISGWATSISAGPANEITQTVSFLVSNNNTALFAVQPAIASNGTLSYTPAANANGSATVTVRVQDDGGTANGGVDTSAAQTFTIAVTAVNDAPSFTKGADQTVLEDAGAQSVSGWAISISAGPANEITQTASFLVSNNNTALFSTQPAIASNGTLTYTPAANANGSATVTVSIKDNGGTANGGVDTSAPQTFTITVTPVNDAPAAIAGTLTANEDASASGALSASDTEGDSLTYSIVANGTKGVATITNPATGAYTYTPNANANGSDSFTFKVNDGTVDSNVATVTVTITPVNDAPAASDGTLTTNEDTSASSALSASDADGDSLTYSIVTNGAKGVATITNAATGAYTYTPNANANGSDSFTFKVNDGTVDSNVATVTVTITPVNDAPVASNGSLTTNEDTPANGTLSASDTEGDSLTYSLVANASKGVATITNPATGAYTYTPNANANGSDSFTFKANDGAADSNVATVSVTITAANDAPVAATGSLTATEDTPANGTLSASDADGDSLTYSLVANASQGSVSVNADGSYTYTPNANANGSDSFTFKANDGTVDSNVATVSIVISEVNDAPTGTNDSLSSIAEDSGARSIPFATLLANDAVGPANESGQTLTITGVMSATGGTASIVGTDVIFTPAANYAGVAGFSYTVMDDGTTNGTADPKTAPAMVDFTITPVNDAPVASADTLTTNEDTSATSALNATDIDGNTLTYSIVTNGTKGVATITNAATGAYTYTPNANANGSDSFTFKVNDGTVDSNVATVSVTITPVNDAPVATGSTLTTSEDAPASGTLSASDTEGDSLTYSIVANGSQGVATITNAATGAYTYAPIANANGSDSFTFKANDGATDSNVATVNVTITEVNDPPIGMDDSLSDSAEDSGARTIPFATLLANDAAGPANEISQTLTIVNAGSAVGGAVGIVGSNVIFTPTLDYTGPGAFSYTLADDGTTNGAADPRTATANATFMITPVDDAPVAAGGSLTTAEDTPANGTLSASDTEGDSLTYSIVANGAKGVATITNAATGAYTYTPNANANGSDSFTFKANDGATDSNVATVSVTITPVNDVPSFTKGADQTVLEDAGAQSVSGWATSISAGPANEITQTVSFLVSNDNTALFSTQPAIAANGTLTYTSVANASGSATVTMRVQDDGGTANGGIDTSAPQTFMITVTPVDDAPVAAGGSLTTTEDTPANGTLSASDTEGDSLTYSIVTNGTKGVATLTNATTGAYTYTPNANANGSDSFTFKANDGTVDSNVGPISVTITPVNDAPVNTVPGAQTANEDIDLVVGGISVSDVDAGSSNIKVTLSVLNGALTLDTSVAGGVSAGQVSGNGSGSLVITAPLATINSTLASANGLTYRGALNVNGGDTLAVATDDQGNSGGAALSDTTMVAITISAVNDAPTLAAIADTTINEDSSPFVVALGGITAGPADENGQTLAVSATSSNPALIPAPGISYSSPSATGTLIVTPTAGLSGLATISVSASDGGSNTAPNVNIFTRTFTITVTAVPVVITSAAPGNGQYGQSYTHTFSAGGNPTISFSVTAGSLPPGLSLNSATGLLSGTPTQAGSFGPITVTVTNLAHSAAQTFTIHIAPAALTVSANHQTKVYGASIPSLSYIATGFVNGDTPATALTGALTTTAVISSSVGSYPISQGTLAASNYTIAFTPQTLDITPAALAVTADDKAHVYGAANPPLTFTATGLVHDDTAASALTGALVTTAGATSPVGSYPITQGTLAASNYTITFTNGALTIATAVLDVVANSQTRLYGAANPPLTYSISGFVNGDTAGILSGALATTAVITSDVGGYAISQGTLGAANYAINYTGGSLSITRVLLTATANDQSRIYGAANPPLTITYSGFVNGESASVLDTAPTAGTPANPTSPIGNYPISVSGGSDTNYSFTYVAGTFSIIPTGQMLCPASALASALSQPGPVINLDGTCRYMLTEQTGTNGHIVNLFGKNGLTINGNGAIIERGSSAGELGLFSLIDSTNVTIQHMTLIGGKAHGTINQLSGRGGGMLLYNSTNVALIGVQFYDNDATLGGGLSIFGGSTTISSGVFANNQATNNGAAIYAQGPATVLNTTISRSAVSPTEAIFAWDALTVKNSIIANHAVGIAAAGANKPVSEDYNLFSEVAQTKQTYNVGTTITSGANSFIVANINQHFINPTAHDYRLKVSSPAIDRGTPLSATIDADGRARPFGTTNPDLGAYEFQGDSTLSIRKTGPRWVDAGAHFSYTLTLVNKGTVTLHDLQVRDTLPQEVSFAGSANAGGTFNGTTVRWDIADLAPGQALALTYQAHISQRVVSDGYAVVRKSDSTVLAGGPALETSVNPAVILQLRNSQQQAFAPNVNGFGFANWREAGSGNDLTPASMYALYGPAVCAPGTGGSAGSCVLSATAAQQLENLRQLSTNGRAFGMVAASLKLFMGTPLADGHVTPADYQAGAATTFDLLRYADLEQAIGLYQAGRSSLPPSTARTALATINTPAPGATAGTPAGLINILLANGFDGPSDNDASTLSVRKRNGNGTLSLLPYALERRDNGVYWLYVYDPSSPGGMEQIIVVDTTANTWLYTSAGQPVPEYAGDAASQTLFLRSAAYDASVPRACGFCGATRGANDSIAYTMNGAGRFLITNSAGQRVGYNPASGTYINEIPGATLDFVEDSAGLDLPPIIRVPLDGTYTTALFSSPASANARSAPIAITISAPGMVAGLSGMRLGDASDPARFTVDYTRRQMVYQANAAAGAGPALELAIELADGTSYHFELTGADVTPGTSVTMGFTTATKQLTVGDTDTSRSQRYGLSITRVQPGGASQTIHNDAFTIGASGRAILTFTNWDGAGWPLTFSSLIYLSLMIGY